MYMCYYIAVRIAQQIIHDWLKDDSVAVNYEGGYTPPELPTQNRVKTKSKRAKNKAFKQLNNGDLSALPKEWNGDLESRDYISGMDFVNTDISHCVEQVMAGMYTHPVEHDVLKMMESEPTTSNPAVTMEMRHKQVHKHYKCIMNVVYMCYKYSSGPETISGQNFVWSGLTQASNIILT